MRLFSYILIIVSFVSCEKEIFNPLDEFEPYVVVNSIISTDSTYAVNLTYSKSIYDREDFRPVEDATIFIAVKDEDNIRRQEFTLNHQGNGLYTRNNNPAEGKIYELLIEVNGEVLRAQTYVPKVVEASVNVISTEINEETEQQALSVEITLNDLEEDDQNFYAWEIEEIINSEEPYIGNDHTLTSEVNVEEENTTPSTEESVSTSEGNVTLSSDPNKTDSFILENRFNNNGINITSPSEISDNGSFTASFVTTNPVIISGANNEADENGDTSSSGTVSQTVNPKYKLRVWAISPDYYYYLKSLDNTGLPTSDNNISGPYSNISNGNGIFAGYNVKEFDLEF